MISLRPTLARWGFISIYRPVAVAASWTPEGAHFQGQTKNGRSFAGGEQKTYNGWNTGTMVRNCRYVDIPQEQSEMGRTEVAAI